MRLCKNLWKWRVYSHNKVHFVHIFGGSKLSTSKNYEGHTCMTYLFNASSLSILASVLGWVLKSCLMETSLPVKGLMMNMCAV